METKQFLILAGILWMLIWVVDDWVDIATGHFYWRQENYSDETATIGGIIHLAIIFVPIYLFWTEASKIKSKK